MGDIGERFTEAEFRRLKPKIEAIYKEAYRDIVKKSEEWAEKHEKRARRYQQMVREGKMSKADYDAWMRGQVFQGRQWKARKQQIADTLYRADRAAMAIANHSRFRVFAENANTMGYGLEEHGRIDTGFTLYDSNSVARLVRDDPDLLPPRKSVGRDASYRWYNRQIGTAITQGIIQGETVREIARRIGKKTGETNCSAMLRNARTMYTGVQNAGRWEGMHQAQRLGIRLKKRWIAILDSKTRDSHQALDGQVQEVDDPFESPLGFIMYPGDVGADDPADVWNCRCSMIYEHPEYPSTMERRDAETGEIVGDMTYKEWVQMKVERAAQTEQAKASASPSASNQPQLAVKSGLTGSGNDGTMSTDSDSHWHPVSLEYSALVPHFTEFVTPYVNEAVRNACVDILTDLEKEPVGTEESISLRLSDLHTEKVKGKPGEGTVQIADLNAPYIAIHNHPSNETLSLADADLCGVRPNCVGIVAVGNNGRNTYSLVKGDAYDDHGFARLRALRMTGLVKFKSDEEFLKEAEVYGVHYIKRTD